MDNEPLNPSRPSLRAGRGFRHARE